DRAIDRASVVFVRFPDQAQQNFEALVEVDDGVRQVPSRGGGGVSGHAQANESFVSLQIPHFLQGGNPQRSDALRALVEVVVVVLEIGEGFVDPVVSKKPLVADYDILRRE